jgi:hypothetical protein
MLKSNTNRIKISDVEIKENILIRQNSNTNRFNIEHDQFIQKSNEVTNSISNRIRQQGKILLQACEPDLGDQSNNLVSGILPNWLGYWKKPQIPLFNNRARYPIGGISIHDIHQGYIGSCYLLSAIASTLNLPTGMAYLSNMIERVNDNYLSVRLFYYEDTIDPEYKPAVILIRDTLPEVILNIATPHAKTFSTTWFAYLEKAYSVLRMAQDEKTYSAYSNVAGGYGYCVYQNIYGVHGTLGTDQIDIKALIDNILPNLDKFPLTVSFKKKFTHQGINYHHPHAYAVTDYINRAGKESIQLFNPWGVRDKHNFSYIPLNILIDQFSCYSTCLMKVSSFERITSYLDKFTHEPVKLIYIDQKGKAQHTLI